MADSQDKIVDGVQSFLESGETVRAALQAQARGHTTSMAAGGVARMVGDLKAHNVHKAAGEAWIRVSSPMGLVLTDRRLLTLEIETSKAMGKATGVRDVMSAIPLSEVDSVQAKRFGLAGVLLISAHGSEVKLETTKVGLAKAFAEAFATTPRTPA